MGHVEQVIERIFLEESARVLASLIGRLGDFEPVKTMQQRLVRAKRKLQAEHIPYAVPPIDLLPERLEPVLAVIYLIFNEWYAASQGEVLIRLRKPKSSLAAITLSKPTASKKLWNGRPKSPARRMAGWKFAPFGNPNKSSFF